MSAMEATIKNNKRPLISVVTETFPPEINGVAHTLNQLTSRLSDKCDIQVVHPRREDSPASTSTFHHERVKGFPIPGYPELRFGTPCRKKLLKLWSDKKPEGIYIATQGPLGWSALRAARELGLEVVSGFHTNFHSYSGHYGMGWLNRLIRGYFAWFHNRTRYTLVPTQQVAESIAAMGIHNARVCSRGIDKSLFNPIRRSRALRQQWGASDDEPVFIYVGRLASEKNVFLALSAFERARQQVNNARMVLVGGGPLQEKIARRYPNVIFSGVKKGEELATHYASADAFLFPSLTETFGNVVLEAVASGLAVVSFDVAAAKEHLVHNQSALLAPPDNADQFCQHVINLATRPSELSRIRKQALTVCQSLDWQSIAEQFLNFLLTNSVKGGTCETHTSLNPV